MEHLNADKYLIPLTLELNEMQIVVVALDLL